MLQFVKDNWFLVAWGLWAFGCLVWAVGKALLDSERQRMSRHPDLPINLETVVECYCEVHKEEGPIFGFFPLALFGPVVVPAGTVALAVIGISHSVVWLFARVRGQKTAA